MRRYRTQAKPYAGGYFPQGGWYVIFFAVVKDKLIYFSLPL
jgi:hypothetical protein